MKIKHIAFTAIMLTIMSCNEDEPLDLEGIEWLQERIAEIQQSSIAAYSYINQAEYKRDRVFIFDNCCPFCASLPPQVYDESGDLLGYVGTDIEQDQLKEERLFWQPDDAECVQ